MTAVHILATARAAGVRVRVDGDDLIVKALSADVIELLKQHKPEVIALLRRVEPLRAELGRILEAGPLPDMPLRRWEQFQIDAANVLRDWADTAIALGWMVDDVFGCDAKAPWHRVDRLGLVWLLNGDRIASMDEIAAHFVSNNGAKLTFYRGQR